MNRLSQYFSELTEGIGRSWNRFWFTPADPLPLAVLRIGTGLVALYFLLSFTPDLVRWFGPHGLLPIDVTRQLNNGLDQQVVWRPSYLNFTDAPELLRVLHGLGVLVVLAMTLGLGTRVTTVLTLIVVLSYVHRAPMITRQMEPILTMVLFYLCLAPCGRCLSLDNLLFRRRWRGAAIRQNAESLGKSPHSGELRLQGGPCEPSWTANLGLRLVQVHLAGFYLVMGLTKLGGDVWWSGTAVWDLIAHTDSRLVDLTFLQVPRHLIDLLTHAIVLFELSFPLFIWNRLARPLLLLVAVPMWLMVGLFSGQVAFCAMLLVANLAFVPASFWRELLRGTNAK